MSNQINNNSLQESGVNTLTSSQICGGLFNKGDRMTVKEKAEKIRSKYNAIPEKQVSCGIYIHTIGHKCVTVLNTNGESRLEKILIDDFYQEHFDA